MAKADKIALKALKVDFNGVDPERGIPERLKILDWGTNKTNQGDVVLNETTAKIFSSNQHVMGRETVQIDFNHNTVPGTEAYKAEQEPRAIGGYGRPVVVEGKGLFLEAVSTTPTGFKHAPDYKDLSPAVMVDEATGTLIGLHSVALTPTGSVYNLTLADAAMKALSASLLTTPVKQNGGDNGGTDYSGIMKQHMDYFRKALNMMGASDDEIMAAVVAKWQGAEASHQGPITPAHENPNPAAHQPASAHFEFKAMNAELQKLLEPLTAKITALEASQTASLKASEKAEKDGILAEASKEGKVLTLSADDIAEIPVKSLRAIVAGLPKGQVPMKATMRVLNAEAPKEKGTMKDAANRINEQLESNYPGVLKTQRN